MAVTDSILNAATRAEALRRNRLLTRLLMRVVPASAGALLIAAVIVRLSHAALSVFWIAAAAILAGVAVFAWLQSRRPAVTDAAATQLDADAGLGGELRSAHWFASHTESNDWTTYHVARAAERIDAVSWPAVYPPVKAARAWAGSAVLALSAIAIVLTSAWPSARSDAARRAGASADAPAGTQIPTELQKQIDDMLKAMEAGTLPMDAARQKISELRNALSELDPKMQAALAKAMKDQAMKAGEKSDPEAAKLAARAEQAANDPSLPEDMKWSMKDLAAKLEKAGEHDEDPNADKGTSKATQAQTGAAEAADKMQAGAVQMTRSTSADSQSSQMMASTASPMGGNARGDTNDAAKKANAAPFDLAALRKETIQADSDSEGANVLAEIRRKSEQSHSSLAFSHVAPLAAYDKSHAAAPPATPDAMKPLVKQYFVRKGGGL
jgi:hypothetical protein